MMHRSESITQAPSVFDSVRDGRAPSRRAPVRRGSSAAPEWGLAFTALDKRIENRPNPPPKGLIGKRIGFHNGAHIGGRPGKTARAEGIRAVLATARDAGWSVSAQYLKQVPSVFVHVTDRKTYVELRKGERTFELAVDGENIVTSAITFTAVIAGYEPPTDAPKYPWQHASDPEDSEDWSYGWHVTDVVVLRAPIPCAGLQGPWTIEREAKRKAKAAR